MSRPTQRNYYTKGSLAYADEKRPPAKQGPPQTRRKPARYEGSYADFNARNRGYRAAARPAPAGAAQALRVKPAMTNRPAKPRKPARPKPAARGKARPVRRIKRAARFSNIRAVKKPEVPVVVKPERMFRLSMALVATFALIFAGLIGLAVPSAMIFDENVKTAHARASLEKINSANAQLSAQLSQSYNLEQIRLIAEGKLGMTEPAPYQIVDINAPRSSYTIEYQQPAARQDGSASIIKDVGGFFAFLGDQASGLIKTIQSGK